MLKFGVDYYNAEHERLLLNFAHRKQVDEIIRDGLAISEAEFMSYSIFREQKNIPEWRTFGELSERLPSRLSAFRDYFDFSSGTVVSNFPFSNDRDNAQTEAAGVGAALSLVSHVCGLTEADWERLPVGKKKDLDFKIASTGAAYIVVEAKGTVQDTSGRLNISGQKKHIKNKKLSQRQSNSRDTMLGVITAFPSKIGQTSECRLVDPYEDMPTVDPRKYKILSRLAFYSRELRLISPRIHLLLALANRIRDITMSNDYSAFDKSPIVNQWGRDMAFPLSLFESKSVLEDRMVFGEVFPLGDGSFYFYGFNSEIIDILVSQDFEHILSYSQKDMLIDDEVTVDVKIKKKFINKSQKSNLNEWSLHGKNRFRRHMMGRLSSSTSGRVFGVLGSPLNTVLP